MLRSPVIDERSKRAVRYYCDVCLCFRTEWLAGPKNDCWPQQFGNSGVCGFPFFPKKLKMLQLCNPSHIPTFAFKKTLMTRF